MRIGVIDDDLAFTDVLSEVLQDRDWDVVVCRDEALALYCMEQAQPDVIILDLRMETSQGGWNLLELLQQTSSTMHIPVIICSADIPALRQRATTLHERGVGVLDKPFDIDALYSAVEAAAQHVPHAHSA